VREEQDCEGHRGADQRLEFCDERQWLGSPPGAVAPVEEAYFDDGPDADPAEQHE
jgi:hypothetical protein